MSVGAGIGGFLDGFSRGAGLGMTIRNQDEAREERARQRKIEDEDRARRNKQEDYKWSRQLEADSREDRMRQVHAEAVRETEAAMGRGLPQAALQGQRPPAGAGKALPAMSPSLEAAQATDRPGAFLDFYMKYGAPKVIKGYLEQGDAATAQAYQQWVETEGVKKGMKSWSRAIDAASRGDESGFFNNTIDAYNTAGYFDDGYTAVREKSRLVKDDAGNIIGAEITFKGEDGKTFTRKFDGIDDLYRASVMFMSPENVFKYGLEQVAAADKARLDAAKTADERAYEGQKSDLSHQRELEKQANASQLRLAEIEAKLPDADEEYREAVAKEREAMLRNEGGVGPYTEMPIDQQIAVAEEAVQKLGVVRNRGAATPSVPAQRRVAPPGGRVE